MADRDQIQNKSRRRLLQAGAVLSALPATNLLASGAMPDGSATNDIQSPTLGKTIKKSSSAMSMNTVRFMFEGKTQWGVVRGDQVSPIPGEYPTTGDFVAAFSATSLAEIKGNELALHAVQVLPPITTNQRFVCQGANYRKHMEESGMNPDDKDFNMIFTKASSCLAPHDTDIIRPSICKLLDYEVELGVVLKKDITGPVVLNESNLHEYIAGATIVNDVSARDVQVPQMQFYKGKSFRTFGPAGPFLCILDKDDMHYLDSLQLTLKVNGEVRQNDNTRDMVFRPAATLTELSQVHDFSAGDLLATGTPAGCALAVPSPAKQKVAAILPEAVKWKLFFKMQSQRSAYLQPGDQIETFIRSANGEIDLGVQRNKIVQG